MKRIKVKLVKPESLEGRLHCFGDFDPTDPICLKYCALNINCAIAKQEYSSFQVVDESISSFLQIKKCE